jgi:hypothetical protein
MDGAKQHGGVGPKAVRIVRFACAWAFFVIAASGTCHGQSNPDPQVGEVRLAIRTGDSLVTISKEMKIDKGEIANAIGIEARILGMDPDMSLTVAGFMLSSVVNDSLIEAVSMDKNFTVEQKTILSTAPKGSHLYLERIRVMGPGGVVHTVGSEVLVVE